mmetsp:Transcript_9634/g.22913  ORF Transcript_9634/g.22913 Transcript_9634/m.22913 type:complete len:206 (+) Transcript_9634:318-935(+)
MMARDSCGRSVSSSCASTPTPPAARSARSPTSRCSSRRRSTALRPPSALWTCPCCKAPSARWPGRCGRTLPTAGKSCTRSTSTPACSRLCTSRRRSTAASSTAPTAPSPSSTRAPVCPSPTPRCCSGITSRWSSTTCRGPRRSTGATHACPSCCRTSSSRPRSRPRCTSTPRTASRATSPASRTICSAAATRAGLRRPTRTARSP